MDARQLQFPPKHFATLHQQLASTKIFVLRVGWTLGKLTSSENDFTHLEIFSYIEVQFKTFCLPAENLNETPHLYTRIETL